MARVAERSSSSMTWSLLPWIALQLAALVVSAARVQLAAGMPSATEALALQVMCVTQIVGAAAVFPRLPGNARSLAVCSLSSIVFLFLASHLAANQRLEVVAICWAHLLIWLIALHLLSRQPSRLWVRTAVLLVAVWVPLVAYLCAEFAGTSEPCTLIRALSPTTGAVDLIAAPNRWQSLCGVTIALVAGAVTTSHHRSRSLSTGC